MVITFAELALVADDPRPPIKDDHTVEDSVEGRLARPLLTLRGRIAGVVDLARVPLTRPRIADVTLNNKMVLKADRDHNDEIQTKLGFKDSSHPTNFNKKLEEIKIICKEKLRGSKHNGYFRYKLTQKLT